MLPDDFDFAMLPLGTDGEYDLSEVSMLASTIETIDTAMVDWIKDEVSLSVKTNEGYRQVPVLWQAPERSYQIKNEKSLREQSGALKLPLISIERTSITKDPARKGGYQAHTYSDKGDGRTGRMVVAKRIVQDKTRNFAVASGTRTNLPEAEQRYYPRENKKVVVQTLSIPIPVYVNAEYKISLRTEYQQQMNEIMVPFITSPGGINYIIISDEHHRYEGFIQQDFTHNNNLSSFSNEERKFETKMNIEVLGHLIGAGKNQLGPNITIRENPVEFKIPRERVMTQDEVEREIGEFIGSQNLPGWSDA